MLLVGPIVKFWGMPFERKNKELRSIATSISSSVNLLWSIAYRYQLSFCNIQQKVMKTIPLINLGTILNPADYELSIYKELKEFCPAVSFSWVEVRSKNFKKGTVVLIESGVEYPVFGLLEEIIMVNERLYFLMYKLKILYFDEHYHAYHVEIPETPTEFVNALLLPPNVQSILAKIDDLLFLATRHQIR
ncbi:hypothetical protein QAD02_012591 [Eretmocerus hayati]|uniref:Uncharacterized protein n=1 Tax=Eretmocerus hayati TaxID=131215 RepID=A0ACC2P2P7_9HYME|nr:hypothetical protein QAD02_012591 [Eretmocerus hayati]